MRNSSPLSRLLYGISLSVAIGLIIVVASSRSSQSQQNTESLVANAEKAARPSAHADDERPSHETIASTAPANEPVEGIASVPGSDVPRVTINEANDAAPSIAASGTSTPSEDLTSETAQPQPTQQDTTNGDPDSAKQKSGDVEKGTQEKKQEANESDGTAAPLKRLSREFARRAAAAKASEPATATPVTPPANEIFQPIISMSVQHRKTCLLFVGDAIPDATLNDVSGKPHSIHKAFGKQLTVIVFWNANNAYAMDQFEELQHDLVPFKSLGVETIAIHVGAPPENYEQLCKRYGAHVLCLTDPTKNYFKKVATSRIPRTYLLDANGKIIWLDMEYSRTTRYELRNALHFHLRDKKTPSETDANK